MVVSLDRGVEVTSNNSAGRRDVYTGLIGRGLDILGTAGVPVNGGEGFYGNFDSFDRNFVIT